MPRSSFLPTRPRRVAGGGAAFQRIGRHAQRQRAFAIHRLAESIDHPAQPGLGGIDGGGAILEVGAGAQGDAVQRTQRHDQGAAVAKADHLAGNYLVISDTYAALAAQADSTLRTRHLYRQPFQAGDPAEAGQSRDSFDFLEQRPHEKSFVSVTFCPPKAPILGPRI